MYVSSAKPQIAKAIMMLFLLGACGGQPPVVDQLGQLNWYAGFGGGFMGYCQTGQSLWLFSVDRAERLDLAAGDGIRVKDQVNYWFGGPNQATIQQVECRPDAIRYRSAEKAPKMIHGEGMAGTITGWSSAKGFQDQAIAFRLSSGGVLEVSRRGWLIKNSKMMRDWRLKASGLIAATIDGDRVWAISERALWRIDLKRSRMLSIALPSPLSKRGLSGLFMDGRVLWLRDKTNQAQPLDIRGHYAYPLANPGKVNLTTAAVKLPLGSGELSWMGPESEVVFRVGEKSTSLIKSVDRILILTPAHVIAASGDYLELWYLGGAKPTRQGRYKMPGKTVALFKLNERILALGQAYGLMVGAFEN